jgi:hypothetical protein
MPTACAIRVHGQQPTLYVAGGRRAILAVRVPVLGQARHRRVAVTRCRRVESPHTRFRGLQPRVRTRSGTFLTCGNA